jgi:hypothetical protein
LPAWLFPHAAAPWSRGHVWLGVGLALLPGGRVLARRCRRGGVRAGDRC